MAGKKAIRFVIVSLALLALFVITGTFGGSWHHHSQISDANCSICHLNHQPVDQPQASDRRPTLATVGHKPEPQEPGFTPNPETPPLPPRAPPAA